MSLTAIRGKDWVFQALWASCPASGDAVGTSCLLNIPITCLFKDGQPFKVLGTDEESGRLKRIQLDRIIVDRVKERKQRGTAANTQSLVFRALLSVLMDYSLYNRYDELQEGYENKEEPLIAKVTYADDQVETLNAKTLEILLRNDSWRRQIVLLQGFVPTTSVHSGVYSQRPQVRSKVNESVTEAADQFASSVAKFVERAYATNTAQALDSASTTSLGEKSVHLKIDNMSCSFGLDPHNKVIFLHADYTAVNIESNQRHDVEDLMRKEKNTRISSATEKVNDELISLLTHAHRRGLSISQSFRHFDVQSNGFIDVDALIDGLARLGMGVTYPVAENLLELIAGAGSMFITEGDFERYLTSQIEDFANERQAQEELKQSTMKAKERTQTEAKIRNKKKMHALLPPAKDMSVLRIASSQEHEWEDDDHDVDEEKELPLSEEMYNTQKQMKPSPTAFPKWASQRSRRALNQLMTGTAAVKRHHQKQALGETATANSTSMISEEQSLSMESLNNDSLARSSSTPSLTATSRSMSEKTERKLGGKSSKKSPSKKRKQSMLTLQSLSSTSMTQTQAGTNDEMLHLENGVIMTYRVLDGLQIKHDIIRTKENADSLRYHSILSIREKNMLSTSSANVKAAEEEVESMLSSDIHKDGVFPESKASDDNKMRQKKDCMTLVIVPDLTMTLDTLQAHFEILLKTLPSIRIVLVGLIGLPNTVWPSDWVLNSELQSKCVANLLQHLDNSSRLFFHPSPLAIEGVFPHEKVEYDYQNHLVYMGFGSGAFHLARFALQQLPMLSDTIRNANAVMLSINGFLKATKKFRLLCKDFRAALLRANVFEANELLVSLLFMDEYLARNNRHECLEKFWGTRRGFRTLSSMQAQEADSLMSMRIEDDPGNGFGYLGILEQLKGLIITPDDAFDGARLLVDSAMPLIVVQSTEDVFVDPKVASVYSPQALPAERQLISDLTQAFVTERPVFVSWLKAGHEVIQERTPFILSITSQLARMCGLEDLHFDEPVNGPEVAQDTASNVANEEEDLFDVLRLSGAYSQSEKSPKKRQKQRHGSASGSDLAENDEHDFDFDALADSNANNQGLEIDVNDDLEIQDLENEDANGDDDQAVDDGNNDQALINESEIARRKRRAKEKMQRAQANLERKKRMLKQARKQELEVFYEREREEKERAMARKELKIMFKEDLRSKYAEEYRIECEITAISNAIAKQKSIDLKALRRQEAIKRVEEDIARKRSERIEKRRKDAMALVFKIAAEELKLQGMQEGGYTLPEKAAEGRNVIATLQSSHRIMKDLLECRQRYVEAIQRQQLMQEKFDMFMKQLQTVENEERRLRRAIRLIEINPSIVGEEMNAETQLHELRSSLINKQESLTEMQALIPQREQQLFITNRSVQFLKMASKERDLLMHQRIRELYALESMLSQSLKTLKMDKENLIVEKDKLRIRVLHQQARIDAVSKELLRVAHHKADLIDTDVWVEGVMQRCVTKELKKHLQTEEAKAEAVKSKTMIELDQVRVRAFDLSEVIAQRKRDCDKVNHTVTVLQRKYTKFSAVSIDEMITNVRLLQRKAESIEQRRAHDQELIHRQSESALTLLDKIRMKESELRSKEERQFVGIDLILFPEEYLHLSPIEAEQMQFDEDYQCALSKTDLQRIEKLPEQINLAIPFLLTTEEILAHRLINKVYRNKDDEYYRHRDFLCLSSASLAATDSLNAANNNKNSSESLGSGGVLDDLAAQSAWKSLTGDGNNGTLTKQQQEDLENAEMIHDLLLRESLRDRLRSAFDDENLTEDERRWLLLDRILCPHVYGLDDDSTDNNANASTDADATAPKRSIDSLANSIVWPAHIPGKNQKHLVDPKTKQPRKVADASIDGDMYQHLRDVHDTDGEDLFDYEWFCNYNRSQLLALHGKPMVEVSSPKDVYIKQLMEKYFISDEESVIGHARCQSLRELSARINQGIREADEEAEHFLEINRKQFESSLHRVDSHDASSTLPSSRKDMGIPPLSSSASQRSIANSVDSDVQSFNDPQAGNQPDEITRIWGSWQQVHPASQGVTSQTSFFRLSTFNVARDHPAAFALKPVESDQEDDLDTENQEEEDEMSLVSALPTARQVGLKTLISEPSMSGGRSVNSRGKRKDDQTNLYFICENLQHLAQQHARKIRNKIVLLQATDTMTLFEENDAVIEPRQSRSHYFQIPDRESARVLSFTVSVVFQGSFTTHGYKLGRLAAALFKLPAVDNTSKSGKSPNKKAAVPIPIGFSPHDSVSPNLAQSMGKIVIFHKPREKPIASGSFQIIIGAAAQSKYSIHVTANYAKTALPVVDEEIAKAKHMQARLPLCLAEMDSVAESLRLAERKLLVCEKMIQEAELECDRCQKGVRLASNRLARDEEEMTMMEDERRELQRELDIFEVEYTQWAQSFTSRCREKEDIRQGIQMMYKFQREREQEKKKIADDLEVSRRDLPSCLLVLRNMTEAVNLASTLNTIVTGISEEEGAAAAGDYGGIRFTTPAEDIRRAIKSYGVDSLSLEEQQWYVLDKALNPHKYEWEREQEEKEQRERELLGKGKKKKKKINPALEPFMLSKSEIEYILETPFSMLTRREVVVRKLLTKFHDDIEFVRKSLSAVAYGFDPHLAERTRAKHPRSYNKEEKEWSTVDRILHPQIWQYYVNRDSNFLDRHSKEAMLVEKEPLKSSMKRKDAKASSSALTKGKKSTRFQIASPAPASAANLLTGGDSQQALTLTDGSTATVQSDDRSIATASSSQSSTMPATQIQVTEETFQDLVAKLQQSTAVKLREQSNAAPQSASMASGSWICPFTRDQILKIWKTPRHLLTSDDERRVYALLHKFNGTYTAYFDMIHQAELRKVNGIKAGSHIQWEKAGKLVSKDIDFRSRQVLREIDRVRSTKNEFIHSDVLHANDQRFPTRVLLSHLEDELDNIMSDQIKDRERAERKRIDPSDSSSSDEDENKKKEKYLEMEDMLYEGIDGENDGALLDKVRKRAKQRAKRREKINELSEEKSVLQTKSILKARAERTSQELADLILISELGTGSCLACRTKRCRWQSGVDHEACQQRKKEIDNEIERIRLNRDDVIFESHVALSSQLGGNPVFRREDLMQELFAEGSELDTRIELDLIDKELHDAYASRAEYFESQHLHGYTVMLWTNHARLALQQRQTRLIAKCVAHEIVEDILDNMLEGWMFGERQSNYQALGFVPTVKANGFIRAGQEQIASVVPVIERMRKRADLKRQGLLSDEMKRGTMIDKAYEIELQSKEKQTRIKVARNNNEHEHLLNETEQTLRFGLFMLTLMYFRAMTFIKREQRSWNDEDDELNVKANAKNKKKPMTDERMRLMDEENKIRQRQKKIDLILAKVKVGDQRRKEREAAERKEAIMRMQAVIRRQRLELYSVVQIQKIYRGHLGRKAARRWALKRAELSAMNALLHAAATTMQRCYRGYSARLYTIIKRTEMAQFIALMRVQEAQQDEEIYWQTHPWSRFKRNRKIWLEQKMEKYRSNAVMGGSRLTAEEQAIMDGKSIEAIRRELQGLGDDSDEDGDEAQDELAGLPRHNSTLTSHTSIKSGKSHTIDRVSTMDSYDDEH